MCRLLPIIGTLFLLVSSGIANSQITNDLRECSLSELEERMTSIEQQLSGLSHFTLRGGTGAIGYRTDYHTNARTPESISISWGKPQKIDQVIIVPVIRREEVNHYDADGFPEAFSVFCGTSDPGNEKLLAEFTKQDELLPRIAPVVINCKNAEASWLRIDTSLLSRSAFDDRYIFQLSEILVFSGGKNVALQADVVIAPGRPGGRPWKPSNVVDGIVPYLMDSAFGETSPAVVSKIGQGDPAMLTIDLQDEYSIDRIHLHAPLVGDTLPYMFDSHFGIPEHLRIEGSKDPDFNHKVTLLNFRTVSKFDTAPIIVRNIKPQTCRYVRLIAKEPNYTGEDPSRTRFGFAEVELFSNDQNVALGKPAEANFELGYFASSTAPLTDGHNLYGKILPIRDWLNELALRHELEKKQPFVEVELKRRYAKQKKILVLLSWLAGIMGITALFGFLLTGFIRQRAIYKTRERIAADIHDELGANLHAIGLLGDLARMLKDKPDEQDDILSRLQQMAKRTGLAARHCTNTLESKELYEDIVEDMRRTTERVAADLKREITFEGKELLRRLKLRRRIDLFLFYKECLTNIIRHSGASSVSAHVDMTLKQLNITVIDNGEGTGNTMPPSLRRRARLFGAKVSVWTPEGGGTGIHLSRKIGPGDLMKGKPE